WERAPLSGGVGNHGKDGAGRAAPTPLYDVYDAGIVTEVDRAKPAWPTAETPLRLVTTPPLLRALLRNPRQQSPDLGLPVAPVTAEGADRRQLACLGPPGDGLGVDPEHGGDLGGREQRLGLGCTS